MHRPEKIICVGQNYRGHLSEMRAREVDEPTLFGKFAATVIADGDASSCRRSRPTSMPRPSSPS